ncbi:MAG: hypothetical protein SVV03_05835 [Candidatus Nanohaloarchaea archaeon]|nr:hypothetical protein [Candidatus Nanohaloarchaea archaeon]
MRSASFAVVIMAVLVISPAVSAHGAEHKEKGHTGKGVVDTQEDPASSSGGILSILAIPVLISAIVILVLVFYGKISYGNAVMIFTLLLVLAGFVVMFGDAQYFVDLREKPSMALEKLEALNSKLPVKAGRMSLLSVFVVFILGAFAGGVVVYAYFRSGGIGKAGKDTGSGRTTKKERGETEAAEASETSEESDEWLEEEDEEVGNW